MNHDSENEVPSKDFVRKIRPAFAGMPDGAPFDKHLLIWFNQDVLQAAFIADVPDAFSYRDSIYHLQQPYIGDWDALINKDKQLTGFSIFLTGDEPIVASDFLRRHPQIRFKDGMLEIMLCQDNAYDIQSVQGIGTRLFIDKRGDYMFLFPQWCEWGKVAFQPRAVGIPIAL
jgi:hypothetical protein